MKNIIKEKIIKAIKASGYAIPAEFSISEPPKREMGDFATNVALQIFGFISKSTDSHVNDGNTYTGVHRFENPRKLAEAIKKELEKSHDFSKVEIAGPGFINLFIDNSFYFKEIEKILIEKKNYGKKNLGKGEKANVEFVSANPTGPLHVGNARGGPIGETIANLFEFFGFDVTKEFYVNDIGGQADKFGRSLFWHFKIKSDPKAEFPEGGYPGEYIKEVSEEIQSKYAAEIEEIASEEGKIQFFKNKGLEIIIDGIKEDCRLIGIEFDVWFRQSTLHKNDESAVILERLKELNATVEKDGALWFKNPEDPDLQDRESVLIKSDKTLTYFTDDIAYHRDKIERGAKILIDVWGANHFGHIPRMKAALRALKYPENILNIILYQYVRLKKSGQAVSMGKRLGNFVTLRQVIEAGVDPDAFKYFILAQNPNTPMDFDIDLAADTSEKNPVFYIKYAHARICSILRKANIDCANNVISTPQKLRVEKSLEKDLSTSARDDSGVEDYGQIKEVSFNLLENEKEIALYKELVKFPELILEVKDNFQLQALPHFAYKIAGLFHDFYTHCQVLTEDKELSKARLALILATKYIISNTLEILGIEAPEKM